MSEIVEELVCPRCGCGEFLEGPHGGAAVNVRCSKCGYWMNIVLLPGGRHWIIDQEELKVT